MASKPNRILIYVVADREELGGVLDELGVTIRERNRAFANSGVLVEIADRGTEDEMPAYTPAESSYFVALVGSTAPCFLVGDFDEAWRASENVGLPRVSAWRTVNDKATPESAAFLSRLKGEMLHYVPRLEHPAQLQLRVWQWLDADGALAAPLEIRDGWARSGDEALVDVTEVPMYSGNVGIAAKRAEVTALDELYAAYIASSGPNSEAVRGVESKRAKAYGELHAMESELVRACKVIDSAEAQALDSWRLQKAREFLDAGNYDAALAVLDDPTRESEYEQASRLAEEGLNRIKANIEEDRVWISAKLSTGNDQETLELVKTRYESAIAKALEHRVCLDVLFDYASLFEGPRSIEIAEQYLRLLQLEATEEKRRPPQVLRRLAYLYHNEMMNIRVVTEGYYPVDPERPNGPLSRKTDDETMRLRAESDELQKKSGELYREALAAYTQPGASSGRGLMGDRELVGLLSEYTTHLVCVAPDMPYPVDEGYWTAIKDLDQVIDSCAAMIVRFYSGYESVDEADMDAFALALEEISDWYIESDTWHVNAWNASCANPDDQRSTSDRWAKAEEYLLMAIDLYKTLSGNHPAVHKYQYEAYSLLVFLGGALRYRDSTRARKCLLEGRSIFEKMVQEDLTDLQQPFLQAPYLQDFIDGNLKRIDCDLDEIDEIEALRFGKSTD